MRNVTSTEFCIFNGHTYVLSSGADFCVAAKLIHLPLDSSALDWQSACPYDVLFTVSEVDIQEWLLF